MSKVVVNDALGLAQFLTKAKVEKAVGYVLGIDTLSFNDWKKAKEILPLPALQQKGRIFKEGCIKGVVTFFINTESDI